MALTKKDHVKYWLKSAEDDLDAMNYLFKGRRYIYALFFAHLYLEKLCKALWVKNNKRNVPPKIHNLAIILDGANIRYSQDQLDFLIIMNNFQLEGRYPDYGYLLHKTYLKSNTNEMIKQVKAFSQWLQQQL